MLQGGSDASNTDPLATEPAEGEEWVISSPHVMLLLPGELDQRAFSTDHDAGEPYIMWREPPTSTSWCWWRRASTRRKPAPAQTNHDLPVHNR
jgi:hypothetical protein